MLRPDSNTSNSSFFARLSIDESTSGFDFATKVGVPHGVLGHQIHAPSEQMLKGVAKIKIPIGVCPCRLTVRHIDDEIDVARRLQSIRCGRTKHVQSPHAKAAAEFRQSGAMLFDEGRHASYSTPLGHMKKGGRCSGRPWGFKPRT